MSIKSEHVKKWRREFKKRIVAAFGGACLICHYNRCNSALSLHHLDPSQKDFSFGKIRANPKNWETIVSEIRKCILVCHNCHSEIHDGLISELPTFMLNEQILSYKELNNKSYYDLCCCGADKKKINKFCSQKCAKNNRSKINWKEINFEIELKNLSIPNLADKLGCSDSFLYRKLKQLGIKMNREIYNQEKNDLNDHAKPAWDDAVIAANHLSKDSLIEAAKNGEELGECDGY